MRRELTGAILVITLAMSASVARADRIEIRHEPVDCVLVDRYLRVLAQGVPSGEVAKADLLFRVDAGSPWYTVHMARDAEGWSAFLPRPLSGLERFEYRVVMASRDRATSSTAPAGVRVGSEPAECGGEAAVTAAIVVSVPEGAPVVPPVPPGFSPTGVVSDQKLKHPDTHKTLKILAGTGLVGGIAVVALTGTSEAPPPEPDIPEFFFDGTLPNPGSVLHLSSSQLIVFVRMSREPSRPLTFTWRFEMQSDAGPQVCVVMSGVFLGAQSPPSLSLFAPLVPTGLCGERFGVRACHLTIQVEDQRVLDQTLDLPFQIEP